MSMTTLKTAAAAAFLLGLAGCSNSGSCVCTNVSNASDVITVPNDGGCGTVQATFTDPRRSCFPASGSIVGPEKDPLIARLSPDSLPTLAWGSLPR